ncbi:oligosaccharide flippase family protein [Vibrio alginolyticus]|uniref:oligosaccharide flippase family protein n=1 Tax=Vibrio alginolyticus TaxID=663 RepID=UPI0028F3F3B3|nr:oligosaccharide flippase family protein [Vibrio alginolyticus]WMN48320.1 oligosaccharide flippase family protein [Vibrio alginolyticus]
MNLAKNALIYVSSSLLSKSVPFLLLPYLTRVMAPESIGLAALYMIYFAFFGAIVGGNSQAYISRDFFKNRINNQNSRLLWGVISYNFFQCLAVFLLVYLFTLNSNSITGLEKETLLLLPIFVFFNVIYQHVLTILRCDDKPLLFATFEFIYSLVSLFTILVYVNFFEKDWAYQFWSVLFSNIVLVIFSFHYILSRYKFEWQASHFVEAFKFCIPQIFYVAAGLVITLGDRYIINELLGSKELGVYSIVYTLVMVFGILVDAYTRSYSPQIYKNLSCNKDLVGFQKSQVLLIRSFFLVTSLSGIYYAILYLCFGIIVGSEFQTGASLIFGLSFAVILNSLYKLIFPFLIIYDFSNLNVIVSVVSASINVVLNYKLVPVYGITGAVYATVFAYFLIFTYGFFSFYLIKLRNKS